MVLRPSGSVSFSQVPILINVSYSSSMAAFHSAASGPPSASSCVRGISGSLARYARSASSNNASHNISRAIFVLSLEIALAREDSVDLVISGGVDVSSGFRRSDGFRASGFPASL